MEKIPNEHPPKGQGRFEVVLSYLETQIPNEHLETKAAREEYAKNFCPPKGQGRFEVVLSYLETLIYSRNMFDMKDDEIIDKFELPWDKRD